MGGCYVDIVDVIVEIGDQVQFVVWLVDDVGGDVVGYGGNQYVGGVCGFCELFG